MPSNVTHRFVSPILWKLIQPLYSSAIQYVFAAVVVYTHRSVPPKFSSKKSHEFASFSLIHSILHGRTLEENT